MKTKTAITLPEDLLKTVDSMSVHYVINEHAAEHNAEAEDVLGYQNSTN